MSDVLVGRGSELERVQAFLARARAGSAALVLEGEAGIGKTAVWLEGLELGAEAGFRVLRARPSEAEAALPFVALVDLLDGVVERVLNELPPAQTEALTTALLLGEPVEAPTDQLGVSLAVLSTLRVLVDEGPVVLALDDLPWLDAPTERVLAFALRRLDAEPVGLLATRRVERGAARESTLPDAFAGDRCEVVLFGPLSLNALDLLLRSRLELALPRPRLEALLERSGGNPLHALELGRALASGARLAAGEAVPVAASLADLVEERAASLSHGARELLLEAAALARPAVAHFAAESAFLDEALESGLLQRDGERLRFAHPLYGSAVLARVPHEDRRAVHRHLAGRLQDPDERALHLALAAEGPDEAVAAALEEAAGRADARGAPEAAAELAERALRLTPAERVESAARRGVQAGERWLAAGDGPHARELLTELSRTMAPGLWRARTWTALAASATDFAEAIRLLEAALGEANETEPGLRGRIQLDLGAYAFVTRGDSAEWEARAVEAEALATAAGDDALLADALSYLAWTRWGRGESLQRELMERAIALQAAGTLYTEAPRTKYGAMLAWSDRAAEGRPLIEADVAAAHQRGELWTETSSLTYLVLLECLAGDFVRAEALAERCLELADQLDIGNAASFLRHVSSLVDVYRGRADRARATASAGLEIALAMGDVVVQTQSELTLGFLELSLGDAEAAARWLAPLPRRLRSWGVVEPALFPAAPNAAEALTLAGRLDEAAAIVAELEAVGERLDRAWALVGAARGRALLQAAQGDVDGALAALDASAPHLERLGNAFERARTELVRGIIQRRARRKGAAKAALDEALQEFQVLGTPLWAERAREEIRRIGLRPSRDNGLTPTESRVAELVAAGRTNREVASELFLSVKTVEANLSRIYGKLGVRSRTELANRMQAGASSRP
jgi:DNA-binding CsgD family transcriptional regulator